MRSKPAARLGGIKFATCETDSQPPYTQGEGPLASKVDFEKLSGALLWQTLQGLSSCRTETVVHTS